MKDHVEIGHLTKYDACKYDLTKYHTLFTNGRQPGTSARPNMESRRFGIKICFCANFNQVTGQLTLKLSLSDFFNATVS